METPRPILDVENLEPYNWPKRDWSELLTDRDDLYWITNAYRSIQNRLITSHSYISRNDDPKDPDPYARYYVFYCLNK